MIITQAPLRISFVGGGTDFADFYKKYGEVCPAQRLLADLEKGKWDPVCPIGNEKTIPLPNLETHQDPPNAYAISKYTQELIGLKLGRLYDIPTVVLRYSIAHGPRQSIRNFYSGALRIFTLQLLSGKSSTIYEDGRQLRDYVSVYDVARANVLVLENDQANYEVFNVGGGQSYSVLELFEMIAKKLGLSVNPKLTGEFRLGDIRHAVSDISKLSSLGWRPQKREEESVAEYIDWIKTQKIDKSYLEESEKSLRKM